MDDCIFCKNIITDTSDNLKNSANLKVGSDMQINLIRHSEHSEESIYLGGNVWILRYAQNDGAA